MRDVNHVFIEYTVGIAQSFYMQAQTPHFFTTTAIIVAYNASHILSSLVLVSLATSGGRHLEITFYRGGENPCCCF